LSAVSSANLLCAMPMFCHKLTCDRSASGDFCQLPCVTPSLSMYDADIQQFKEENKVVLGTPSIFMSIYKHKRMQSFGPCFIKLAVSISHEQVSRIRVGGAHTLSHTWFPVFHRQANMRKDGSRGNVYLNHIDLLVPIGTLNVNKPGGKTFAFQTNFWKEANFEYFELTKSHRQSDKALIDALGEVRSGNISQKTEAFFKVIFAILRWCPKPSVFDRVIIPGAYNSRILVQDERAINSWLSRSNGR